MSAAGRKFWMLMFLPTKTKGQEAPVTEYKERCGSCAFDQSPLTSHQRGRMQRLPLPNSNKHLSTQSITTLVTKNLFNIRIVGVLRGQNIHLLQSLPSKLGEQRVGHLIGMKTVTGLNEFP